MNKLLIVTPRAKKKNSFGASVVDTELIKCTFKWIYWQSFIIAVMPEILGAVILLYITGYHIPCDLCYTVIVITLCRASAHCDDN